MDTGKVERPGGVTEWFSWRRSEIERARFFHPICSREEITPWNTLPAARLLAPFLVAALALLPTQPATAATIAYSINGSTNDFQGTIDVTDLTASISSFSNVNFIIATG